MSHTSTRQPVKQDQHWPRLPVGAPVHGNVVPYAKTLLERESGFHQKNCARIRIYRGVELRNNRSAIQALEGTGRGIARLNVTKSICDTFSSRLSKDRPMPGFVVDDSDWELKRKSQKYREFITGQMLETEFDDLSRDALHDGTRLGFAFTRIDDDADSVLAERIPFNDLLFDRRECRYGKPQQAIRLHRIAKDHLAELYPKLKDVIRRAPAAMRRKEDTDAESGPNEGDLSDYTDVYTAIHLPWTADSETGRRVVCIEGATLSTEIWHEPRFPWSMFQLVKPDEGIYPDGFVDLLAAIQHRINLIVRDIQLNLAATGRGFFMVNEANDIPTEMLTGFLPFKLKFKGSQAPQWEAPTPFNAAQMGALDRFIQAAYDLTGVSKASAESKSTLGPGASGVALDTQYDIDSDRFRMPQANYARYRLNGAQCYLDAAARVSRRRSMEKGKKRSWVATTWKGRDAIQKLDYDAVTLKEGTYRLRIEPVGFLPDTRAGKLSVVEQLAKAGVIPQWMVPALFDEPDLEEANRIILAPYRNCLRKMDLLIEIEEEAPMPEAYNDLDLELKVSTAFYNWVQCEKAPEEVQQRFRDYIDAVTDLLKKKAPATDAAAMAVPPGAMPADPSMPMPPNPGGVPLMPSGPLPPPIPIGAVPPPVPMAA
jgi:hypothetical protein